MKTLMTIALLVICTVLPCPAQQPQQREKPRPGPFPVWGPVHTLRDEWAAITIVNGEKVEGPRTPIQTLTYNEDGTKQEQLFYQRDGSVRSRRVSLRDQDGRLLEETEFNSKGEQQSRAVYKYDGEKKLVERVVYRPDGSLLSKTTSTRQGNQTISESTLYGRDGAVIHQSTTTSNRQTTPDKQTNSYESLTYSGGRVFRKGDIITRTPNGVQMKEEQSNRDFSRRETFVPDGKGDIELTIYNDDGTVRARKRSACEFDSHGNFIKSILSVAEADSADFKPVEVTYRTIEYYQ